MQECQDQGSQERGWDFQERDQVWERDFQKGRSGQVVFRKRAVCDLGFVGTDGLPASIMRGWAQDRTGQGSGARMMKPRLPVRGKKVSRLTRVESKRIPKKVEARRGRRATLKSRAGTGI
jgi:hypothetical protein